MKKTSLLLLTIILVATSCTKKKPESTTTCYCYYFQAGGIETRVQYALNGGKTGGPVLECMRHQTILQSRYGVPNAKCSVE